MKTIILLIALILCNLSFSCEILPNGNYIPCYTNMEEKIFEYELKRLGYDKASIENKKIIDNIEYNVKLAESRLNEAEVKYIESIKKYKTTPYNAGPGGLSKQIAYSEMLIAKFEYEKARWECGRIYALAKGESIYNKVGKSPLEIWKLIK